MLAPWASVVVMAARRLLLKKMYNKTFFFFFRGKTILHIQKSVGMKHDETIFRKQLARFEEVGDEAVQQLSALPALIEKAQGTARKGQFET